MAGSASKPCQMVLSTRTKLSAFIVNCVLSYHQSMSCVKYHLLYRDEVVLLLLRNVTFGTICPSVAHMMLSAYFWIIFWTVFVIVLDCLNINSDAFA